MMVDLPDLEILTCYQKLWTVHLLYPFLHHIFSTFHHACIENDFENMIVKEKILGHVM